MGRGLVLQGRLPGRDHAGPDQVPPGSPERGALLPRHAPDRRLRPHHQPVQAEAHQGMVAFLRQE